MTESKPEYHTDNGQKSINENELLALRADLIRLTVRLERYLEITGRHVDSVIVTRNERRRLTKK